MKVWIDQDLCTGDGLCEEIAPSVFTLLDDGLAYVKEGGTIPAGPKVWPTCPRTWRMPPSKPPRSVPGSASSSRSSDRYSVRQDPVPTVPPVGWLSTGLSSLVVSA
jgi:hypothetical protein